MTCVPGTHRHRPPRRPGERLEHTRPSYLLAIEQGADFIEPDVVSTKDGVLVVRHENEIGGTTDVADRPEFLDRKVSKFVDGIPHTGWFTEDFTLEEIKTLRVRERLPALRPQNLPLEHVEKILTFDEVLNIAEDASEGRDEPIGVYVETKHPTYFAGIGHDLNDLLVANLERRRVNHAGAKIIIQSMETGNLRRLRDRTPLPLIQLMDRQGAPYDLVEARDRRTYADLVAPKELATIADVRRRDRAQQEPGHRPRQEVPAGRPDGPRPRRSRRRADGAHLDDAQREQLPADQPADQHRQGRPRRCRGRVPCVLRRRGRRRLLRLHADGGAGSLSVVGASVACAHTVCWPAGWAAGIRIHATM